MSAAAKTTAPTDDASDKVASLSNGWNRYARDLDLAWRIADLSVAESIVLWAIIRGCWVIPIYRTRKGTPAPGPMACVLNISDLARRNKKRSRTTLQRALANLLAYRMVVAVGKDSLRTYRINKDFTTWVTPAKPATATRPAQPARPMFDSDDLQFIRGANDLSEPQPSFWTTGQPSAPVPMSELVEGEQGAAPPAAPALHPLPRRRDTPCPGGATPPVATTRHPL